MKQEMFLKNWNRNVDTFFCRNDSTLKKQNFLFLLGPELIT